ncbi:glutathione ABC transporter substrate-binding protein [Salipaludibacillus agaradhaerens]|uniref:glutathione ABC transporter substrate-binding protein n=1 Tax=Salipaludibacillus agaradhaerens TaxID=76935 RepID=UPI002150A382|nr:glutathione ABC transporter substrate-binding protein [Salipaludibacillus agaradhaerens]MCR6107274.1 glutathione ABC transporter substrate-binding protein [Salipaludibacillus agaradhaerens]MCR6119303.1 glutathione ABC transporter substrate-binding protein [Salipaludibacillus agaradhaerens]UJW58341.1 glutathione ABC transporter substrate-binding protein [Bacillus sp. A116_S68]
MFKTKTMKACASSLVIALAIAGCASEPDDGNNSGTDTNDNNNNTSENEAGTGESGGDLVVGVLSDASSLDPHTSNDVPSGNIQVNLYETLVNYDDDMELEPGLAEEWEPVEDNVWHFTLAEGVEFHDGEPFNAEAVKVNIDRILDEEIGSPRKILFEIVEEVNVIDEHTVEFVTEDPFAPLPAHLAHYASSIISPQVIEDDYAAMEDGAQPGDHVNEHPYGTGYFKFDSWDTGNQVVLTNNENYWGENAKVDTVTFKVIPEDLTRIGELESGSAHIIDPVTPSDMARVENSDGTNVYQRNAASITYLGFNVEKEPFDDARVRQAIAMTLDKEAMLEGILEGTGDPALGPVNETNFGFSENVNQLERDPERAQELLAEAGYEDGFETTIWTNDSRERMDIAELVQADLSQIGIEVDIEVVEWGAYLDQTGAGEHDMFILGLSLGTGDADYPMHMLFHSNNVGASGNRSFFADETFDALLQEARVEQDEEARLSMYEEATNYLLEESPMAFLYHPDHIMGYSDSVSGFWADGSGLYQLKDVTIQ